MHAIRACARIGAVRRTKWHPILLGSGKRLFRRVGADLHGSKSCLSASFTDHLGAIRTTIKDGPACALGILANGSRNFAARKRILVIFLRDDGHHVPLHRVIPVSSRPGSEHRSGGAAKIVVDSLRQRRRQGNPGSFRARLRRAKPYVFTLRPGEDRQSGDGRGAPAAAAGRDGPHRDAHSDPSKLIAMPLA